MTYREKLAKEHPECIDSDYEGGCQGCPCDYGYEGDRTCRDNHVDCKACWDREIPSLPKTDSFDEIITAQIKRCTDVLLNKSKEYAADGDRLHNFHMAAGMMGCSTLEALAGMMAKHTISVYDMCRSGEKYPIDLWNEKITDHINYLLLLRAAVEEENGCRE